MGRKTIAFQFAVILTVVGALLSAYSIQLTSQASDIDHEIAATFANLRDYNDAVTLSHIEEIAAMQSLNNLRLASATNMSDTILEEIENDAIYSFDSRVMQSFLLVRGKYPSNEDAEKYNSLNILQKNNYLGELGREMQEQKKNNTYILQRLNADLISQQNEKIEVSKSATSMQIIGLLLIQAGIVLDLFTRE